MKEVLNMEIRPDYVLKVEGQEPKVFKPYAEGRYAWIYRNQLYTVEKLQDLGATPVEPEPEPVVCSCRFYVCGSWAQDIELKFKTEEDAENWWLRVQSIAPEWTGREPEDGQTVYVVTGSTERFRKNDPEDIANLLSGIYQPTKERAEEWLGKYGKAWGLR